MISKGLSQNKKESLLLDDRSGSDYSGEHRHQAKLELFAGLS